MFTKDELVGKSGSFKTQSIFLETSLNDTKYVIMTLKEGTVDYKGNILPSLREEFMKDNDPTGYTTAIRVFGSWEHWKRLKANALINKYIMRYEEEMDIKIRSGAVKALIETAINDGGKGTTAAKYIAEKGWEKRPAGAPSKLEKERELKVQSRVTDEVQEDLERLGLH